MTNPFYSKIMLIFCLSGFLGLAPLNLAAQSPPDEGYVIGARDILEIRVWDNEDLHRRVEVSPDGIFTFPLIGQVHAAGLSVFGLETVLKKRLADGYLVAPQVTVTVVDYESQKVFLFGEVKKPGTYVLERKTHLVELISEAGGFTDRAGPTVTIVRPTPSRQGSGPVALEEAKQSEMIMVALHQFTAGGTDNRCLISAGDSIYVSKSPRIFVTGEVKKPGEFRWETGLTVRQAVSLAGGPSQRSAPKRTKIIRIENGVEKEIKPGMSDLVMPGDIIRVPESYF
ncbi:MAG: SLBB domain-containing protein [Desulfobacterales bacterium]|nr:SLBB domain-containing protein [Desulfobacterales bacterium]